MATTTELLKATLGSLFGWAENSSRDVENFGERITEDCIFKDLAAVTTATQEIPEQELYACYGKRKVKRIMLQIRASTTISATDTWRIVVLKRSASTYSVTSHVGDIVATTDRLTNKAFAASTFSLTSSSNLELVEGDTLTVQSTQSGGGAGKPAMRVLVYTEPNEA